MSPRVVAHALFCTLLPFLSCITRSAAAEDAHAREAPAAKRELVAVLIVADGDGSLSDNLTEVALSTLAGSREWDFVGLKELRTTLSRLEAIQRDGLEACLEHSMCRQDVVRASGATRAILGRVRARADRYSIELVLSDATQPESDRVLERSTAPTLRPLISGVQSAVRDLVFETQAAQGHVQQSAIGPSRPPQIPALGEAEPASASESHPLGPTNSGALGAPSTSRSSVVVPASAALHLDQRSARASRTPPARYVAYGAAAASVLSFSAAAITGSIAAGAPTGNTRAEVEADLHRREGYQTAAISLLVTGAVLATVSLVSLTFHR